MLEERPNKEINWKARLEELDVLPDETILDKTAAWEMLHLSLKGNSHNRVAGWYWMAAACVLALIIYLPLSRKTTDYVVVSAGSTINKIKPAVSERLSATGKSSVADISQVTDKRKPVKQIIETRKVQDSKAHGKSESGNDSSLPVSSLVVAPEPTVSTSLHLDTAVFNTVPVFVVKKKLRVVHINEIGAPIEDEPKDAKYAEHQPLYKGLANQDVFNNTASNTQTFRNGFIKIKTTSQN